jgi:hypothetical protein
VTVTVAKTNPGDLATVGQPQRGVVD